MLRVMIIPASRRKAKVAVAIAGLLYLAGCQGPLSQGPRPGTEMAMPAFNASEAAHVLQRGQTQVSGQAWLLEPSGDIREGALSTVELIPETAYSKRYVQRMFGKRRVARRIATRDENFATFQSYLRRTTTDHDGNFSFANVAAGNYYVIATMSWPRPGQHFPEGAHVYQRVTVPAYGAIEVDLSGHYDPAAPL